MNAELIAKLRRDVKWIPGKCYVARLEEIMDEAADALEAAQAEIERLNGYVQKANMDVTAACVERDAALARLAELEKQEPVIYKAIADNYQNSLKPPAPDCRTCKWIDHCKDGIAMQCTTGDKYEPAPKVVLWRTE